MATKLDDAIALIPSSSVEQAAGGPFMVAASACDDQVAGSGLVAYLLEAIPGWLGST